MLNDGEDFLRLETLHEKNATAPCEVAANDWLRLDNDIACTQPRGDLAVVVLGNTWSRGAD